MTRFGNGAKRVERRKETSGQAIPLPHREAKGSARLEYLCLIPTSLGSHVPITGAAEFRATSSNAG